MSAPPLPAGAEPAPPPLLAPLATPPLAPLEAEGLDLILEGFLLHHGRPRAQRPADPGARVLSGDLCYAQGLVRVAASGDLAVIDALAQLIARAAGLVAQGRRSSLCALWLDTVAGIAARGGRAADPRAARAVESGLAEAFAA